MKALPEIAKGSHCAVRMTKEVADALEDAPAKDRGRCKAMMNRLAEHGPNGFNKEQFRMEDRISEGGRRGRSFAIYAFKSYQVRIYGGWVNGDFVCVEYELKKKNKADRKKFGSAASKLGELME